MHLTFHLLVLGECLIDDRDNNLSELGVMIRSIFSLVFSRINLSCCNNLSFMLISLIVN